MRSRLVSGAADVLAGLAALVLFLVTDSFLHVGADRLSLLDGVPQQEEHGSGHVGMTNDLVRPARQFVPAVDADPLEHAVARENDAALVGPGIKQLLDRKADLVAADGDCWFRKCHSRSPADCQDADSSQGASDRSPIELLLTTAT